MAAHSLFVILGNQLFPLRYLKAWKHAVFFMAEDHQLCTYVRHHKLKIVLFLAAMRAYAEELRAAKLQIHYHRLEDVGDLDYEEKLSKILSSGRFSELVHFEVEDKFMEERLSEFAKAHDLAERVLPSPMFMCSREEFESYLDDAKRPFMADFYRQQRKRLDILVEPDGKPTGGKWSFDAENRKKLPKNAYLPRLPRIRLDSHVQAAKKLVQSRFDDHPGDVECFWLPTTRRQALSWLNDFLRHRLKCFGDHEDALTTRSDTVFHSVLTPSLNIGLITPGEVIHKALAISQKQRIPINSLEGFVRQVIGWREFIRGIYRAFSEKQEKTNFWGHRRKLTKQWYTGDTGILPLDHTIKTAARLGWTHHIPRLMVVGNLMTLCEIQPAEAHRWFMEMYVDSADWVMGPNVYGMGLFSDGGIFATKPYVCGSNYLLKMSDYPRGDWCDVVDGLYWRFTEKHIDYFGANPRLSVMTRALAKMNTARKARIYAAAEGFIEANTKSR